MSTRLPPSGHCKDCPLFIHLLDACPLTPFWSIYNSEGLVGFQDLDRLIELFMVFLSLVPWIFSTYLIVKLLIVRNQKTLIRGVVHLVAHITCDVVKVVWFREDRPDGSCSLKYGLPSCHSIFAGVYTTWILIDIFIIRNPMAKRHIFALFVMIFVPYSRIFLIYHTLKQCIYGWIIGSVFASVGFAFNQYISKQRKVKDA